MSEIKIELKSNFYCGGLALFIVHLIFFLFVSLYFFFQSEASDEETTITNDQLLQKKDKPVEPNDMVRASERVREVSYKCLPVPKVKDCSWVNAFFVSK